jgi:plastin-1
MNVIFEVLKIGLLSNITLSKYKELVLLLEPGEDVAKLRSLLPEQLLLRWFNYHLKKSGSKSSILNFADDLKV